MIFYWLMTCSITTVNLSQCAIVCTRCMPVTWLQSVGLDVGAVFCRLGICRFNMETDMESHRHSPKNTTNTPSPLLYPFYFTSTRFSIDRDDTLAIIRLLLFSWQTLPSENLPWTLWSITSVIILNPLSLIRKYTLT